MNISFQPPVGSPIRARLKRRGEGFDWSFGGAYRAFFVDSGTSALRIAVEVALHRSQGAKSVWIPAYGCPDIVAACRAGRAEPTLYDTQVDRPFYLDEQPPPRKCAAVIAAHFLGLVHPCHPLMDAAGQSGAVVIEDSAQRFPMPGDRPFGDLVVFSFGRGKPVSLMEGGCVLAKESLSAECLRVLARYPIANVGAKGAVKRFLHDAAIRPLIYGCIRHLPGMTLGEVRYRDATEPLRMGPTLSDLAGRAVSQYRRETDWLTNQMLVTNAVLARHPSLQSLPRISGQDGQRLLRASFLATDPCAAERICCDYWHRGVGASRMYGCSQPRIDGMPANLKGPHSNADQFAARILTVPIPTRISDIYLGQL